MKQAVLHLARGLLPSAFRQWLWARWHGQAYIPPVGSIRLGSLRRVTPISRDWGYDRGLPVDRYYIEQFLSANKEDICGHVLEIADAIYTRQFGEERVTQSDVLHVDEGNPHATIVADLTRAENIPSNTFNCIILTQTLQFIYDTEAAVETIWRILKPGGIVLATFPGISHICRREEKINWGDHWLWSFTTLSAQKLFERVFPPECVQIMAYGNVLSATAFLFGLASQELRKIELDARDIDYEVLVTVRAIKPVNSEEKERHGNI